MTPSPDPLTPSEYEATLAIVSENPAQIRAEIAGLSCVGKHEIVPADLFRIRDVYLDSPTGDLRKSRWALRIRFIRGNAVFTLKGPASKTAWGGIERPELEESWSPEAPSTIKNTLVAHGVQLTLHRTPGINMPPVEALERSGFVMIQNRETRRELRRVLGASSRSPIGELALDWVSYSFGKEEVRHIELEIEAKDHHNARETKAVVDYLLALYSPELIPWNYGKLATGLALQEWLRTGELAERIRPGRYLEPSAYSLLADYLERLERPSHH